MNRGIHTVLFIFFQPKELYMFKYRTLCIHNVSSLYNDRFQENMHRRCILLDMSQRIRFKKSTQTVRY